MISKKGIMRALATSLVLGAAFMMLFTSCDKRRSMNSEDQSSSNAYDILVTFDPPQVYLPSGDAVDTVDIAIAVLDSEGVGIPGVRVNLNRTPAIGYLTTPDTTNGNGVTSALFVAQPGQYGVTVISARVDTLIRTTPLYISGPSAYTLAVEHWPTVPKLIDRNGDPYVVTATLIDTTGTGVPNQPVDFSILNGVGRLVDTSSTGSPKTNNEGMVSVLFYNTAADELNNPTSAMIQAVATTPSDSDGVQYIAATTEIMMIPVHNTLNLEAQDSTVFGDGVDSTLIRAILLDTYGHGIEGDTVRFRNQPFDGSIPGIAITNENGIATGIYHPFQGRVGSTMIFAEYKLGTIHAADTSVSVEIMPLREIAFVTASLQKQNVVANGDDSTQIFITVQDSSGGLIADGTTIHLEHTGTGFLSPTQTTTTDGQAVAVLKAPANIVGSPNKDTVFVWGNANDSTIVADTAIVTYIAGPVDELMFIRPESTVVLIAGSGDIDTVQVAAKDANGNPVANGTQITFVNQISTSSLTPSIAPTQDGIATSIYLVGSETGDDNIRAYVLNPTNPSDTIWTVQPVVYRCLSSAATTLQLSSSQGSIVVGGASCQIIATLEDAYGNPLSEGYVVAFKITVAPGAMPPERPSFSTEPGVYEDTIETNINGQAVVQIYSGTKSGSVAIKACTVPSPEFPLRVCDEKSLITISSGPPFTVIISYNANGEASNPNTPERFVQVGAGVHDIFANPVEYGTAVYFTLIPNDIAEIEGDSYTGGARPYHADSVAGWAFTRIIYGCYATNETLQVVASSSGDSTSVADTSQPFALPIFAPVISLAADPGNLWCDGPSCFQTDQSDITALLTDGGGCPVKYGKILFVALVAGSIIGPTFDYTDIYGIAETVYQIRGCEIPTPPDLVPQIETGVRATLFGYPDVEEEVSMICARPQ